MDRSAIDLLKQRLLRSGLALTVAMSATCICIVPTFAATYQAVTWAVAHSVEAQKHKRPGQEPRGAGTGAMRSGRTVVFLHGTPDGG